MDTATTVLKAFDLLGLLVANPSGIRTSEIAVALNQPRTNVLRLLETLRIYGFAAQKGKSWSVTPSFHRWATPADRYRHLRSQYRPVLQEVARQTGELVLLGLHEGNGIVILDHIESDKRIRVAPPETRHSLHHNAFGKLALSRRPDLAAKVSDAGLQRELEEIRRKGVAWNREETVSEMIAMAMPGQTNTPTEPMIAVAWPTFRFTEKKGRAATHAIRMALQSAFEAI